VIWSSTYLLLFTLSVPRTRDSRIQRQTLVPTGRVSHRNELDQLIQTLQLKSVPSGEISFLAFANIYHTEKPYLSRLPSGTNLPRTNLVTSNHQIDVFEISGHESSFALAKSGFEYATSSVQMQQWDDFSVCSEYIPKMESWLQEYLNCERVFIYAYNVSHFFRTASHKSPS